MFLVPLLTQVVVACVSAIVCIAYLTHTHMALSCFVLGHLIDIVLVYVMYKINIKSRIMV